MAPWNAMPMTNLVVAIVTEPSDAELNAALLQLEINGLVHVSQITKTKRRIEVITEGATFLAVDED
jgi:hypothetical protein